ncbi:hypothetical protein ACFYZJ_38850 [Streptomyces sp. NPDC001848]|uniref:hypothetical protein n=1 Tax=Streptomyces sp. NPDC001848 TaxID=3364618 RepID=UPI0036952FA3
MKKLTKRISLAASAVAVAGVAVLGAGGAASAATPVSAPHVEHPAVSVHTNDFRWDHGVGYLIEQGYSWDRVHGWHRDDCVTDAARHGRDGHLYRWDDDECGWKYGRSYGHDWNRYEHDGRDHRDRHHGDR